MRLADHTTDLMQAWGTVLGAAFAAIAFVGPFSSSPARLLARAAGAEVRVVGRCAGRRLVAALAAAADWLRDRYGNHVDLGVDQLRAANIKPEAQPVPALLPTDFPPGPPIHLLERRVQRAVVSGRLAVAGDPDDVAFLQRSAMPRAAAYAQALDESGFVQRDAFGRAGTGSLDRDATAWLAAALYVAAVAGGVGRRAMTPALPHGV